MQDGWVPHEDGRVAYRDFGGRGPAVLLLHGLGGNLAHWGLVAPLLHDRYRLVAVDLPSHGASTSPAVHSFEHDVGAVDEVRRRLALVRPAVVGHSYGGMVAVALGARRPDAYRAVVNIDGLGFALDADEEARNLPHETSVDEGDAGWLEGEITREVAEAAEVGLHLDRDGEMVRRAFQLHEDGRWHSSPTIGRFVEILGAIRTLHLVPDYAASTCRTVTVIAEHGAVTDEETAVDVERLRAALLAAGSELDHVRSGHYAHVEVPEVVAARFGTWLRP